MELNNDVLVRSIRVKYTTSDNFHNKEVFTVESSKMEDAVNAIVSILDSEHFPSWGFSLGKEHYTDQKFVWEIEQIKEYLISNVEASKDFGKSLKLTK